MQTTSTFIPLAEVAKQLPGRPHVSTLHRWTTKGVRGVKLETTRVGSRVYVTQEAIERFLAELNTSDDERLAHEGC